MSDINTKQNRALRLIMENMLPEMSTVQWKKWRTETNSMFTQIFQEHLIESA